MNIILDGHSFTLKSDTGVLRTPLVEWPTNTRLDGQQKRKDRSLLSSYAIDDWSGGLGVERQNVENPNHATRLWDAEGVDTRFPSQIVLSPAFNTCTIVPSRGDLNIALDTGGNLYFIETARPTYGGYAYLFTAPNTLGSKSQLFVSGNAAVYAYGSIRGVADIGAKKVAFCQQNISTFPGEDVNVYVPFDSIGETINEVNVPSYGKNPITRFTQVSNLGGTLHAIEHTSANAVRFLIANQSGGSLGVNLTKTTTVGSYLALLVNDGLNMYAALPEGIYDFDISPSVVISAERMKDKNIQQVMFKNDLYFKNEYSLIHYDGADLTGVGYDLDDGLPADKMGEITAMTSNYKWIYAAVKGATYSHILTRDQNGAWQYFAKIYSLTLPNYGVGLWVREIFLSNSPDGMDRLWCLFDNCNYPGYFLNPVINPLSAGTYPFVSSGDGENYFTKPIFDGGLPEIPGAFYDYCCLADKVGSLSTQNNLYLEYGMEGAIPSIYLGLTSTTNTALLFGSPYGIRGNRIQSRIFLNKASGQGGTTPVFRNAVIHYLKDPDKRESFDFNIDVGETARKVGLPQEAVLATLSAIMDTKTLLPFHYGLVATRAVKVLDIPAQEDIETENIMGGERSAFVRLRVAEIL